MNHDTVYDFAVKLYNNGEYEKAHQVASLLRQMEPLSARAYKILGNSSQAWGKYSWAIGAYQRAFMFNAKDGEVAYQTAQCYIHLQDWAKAKQWLEVAVRLEYPLATDLLEIVKRKFA